jgi:hypothetical protein
LKAEEKLKMPMNPVSNTVQICRELDEGTELCGEIFLRNGKLTFTVYPGWEILMHNVTKDFPKDNQEKYFYSLPELYHGSYMWAQFAKEERVAKQ